MTIKDLETRSEQLVVQAQAALSSARSMHNNQERSLLPEQFTALRASGLAFIESTFGRTHSYYEEFNKRFNDNWESTGKQGLGILTAIRDHIKGGWIETTRGLITGEVFADFLEMAEHLLDEHYKDAAAVMAGSVLEEHLRQLSVSGALPVEDAVNGKVVPRKADRLNSELANANKYSKLDLKQVTAWLDLRNKAAHGKYTAYTEDQVQLMVAGVRDFISRVRP
jgi:hypothetical protein